MSGLLRRLLHRGGTALMILVVAVVAAAAAAAGPTYESAARASILRDTVTSAPVSARGVEVTAAGGVVGTIDTLSAAVDAGLASALGGAAAAHRLFTPAIDALEVAISLPDAESGKLVWHSGACAHLRLVAGACPTRPRQVLASSPFMRRYGWRVGHPVPGPAGLVITGVYAPPDPGADYWFGRTYFPQEGPPATPTTSGGPGSPTVDALFTPRSTIEGLPGDAQGTDVVDLLLATDRITQADVPLLDGGVTALLSSDTLAAVQATAVSAIPNTMTSVQASWTALAVPVLLITAQLLALAWLLLFLVVTDAVEARGGEVALAKLRGAGRWHTLTFGLSEPVALLAVALPVGALVGWAATTGLSGLLLRAGTPVGLPALGWAAAGIATVGGLAATLLAARRTLTRPVVAQWRRADRRATDRGWALDAVLVTAATAGLVELGVTGTIGSAGHGVLALLVPGLLGLAVAVVASRLLPLGCRAGMAVTRRAGGVGGFLAVRHIARRPGGVRTTIVLATAFALATFALAAWTVNRANQRTVAGATVGADTVLTVTPPAGADLGAIVDRVDPSGRRAAAVDQYVSFGSGSAGQVLLAVQPARYAAVAAWRSGYAARPLTALAAKLDPPAPPPVLLNGDALRVGVDVTMLTSSAAAGPLHLIAAVNTAGGVAPTPVDMGPLPAHGPGVLTGDLAACPCTLASLIIQPTREVLFSAINGTVRFVSVQVRNGGRWRRVDAGFGRSGAWQPSSQDHPADTLVAGPAGLTDTFTTPGTSAPGIANVDRPDPLPALIAAPLGANPGQPAQAVGLDGNPLTVLPVAVPAAVPGAPSTGIVVDRTYAERAAGGNMTYVREQVWLAPGAAAVIVPKLKAAGVTVSFTATAAEQSAQLARQGPALASVLFLADAAAAALLAAGGAVLGLYVSARRRRYEFAALAATGARRRSLRIGLLLEQAVVLGFGALVGIAAGLAAAALAVRAVPEFVTPPVAPPLAYTPAAGTLTVLLAAAVAVLLAAALLASTALVSGVRSDLLREAPP